MKQIAVIGLGQFGSYLATALAKLKCDVLAIDLNEDAVSAVRDQVQQAIITDVRNEQALQSVITDEIDEVIICFSENMEASILCTLHLANLGVKRIRAKAANSDHATILKSVGATEVIFPEQETAKRMAQQIVNPDLLDYLPLSEDYQVVEINVPKSFVNRTLADLGLRQKYRVLVIAIKDTADQGIRFMPAADTALKADNTMVIMGQSSDLDKLKDED